MNKQKYPYEWMDTMREWPSNFGVSCPAIHAVDEELEKELEAMEQAADAEQVECDAWFAQHGMGRDWEAQSSPAPQAPPVAGEQMKGKSNYETKRDGTGSGSSISYTAKTGEGDE